MILDIQMTLPAMVVDSFASFKGDSAATGTAQPATRMTLPVTRQLCQLHGSYFQLLRLFWKTLN
jgi:hypothetical protein